MNDRKVLLGTICAVLYVSVFLGGCAVNFYKQNPRSKQKIKELESKVDELEKLRMKEQAHFEQVKSMLEGKLSQEISDKQISLEMQNGGLAIILSDDILFDSGKADIKQDAYPVLDKVASILEKEVPNKDVGIGGHTDNVPITYSNWKSNWELSSARATNVLYYLEKAGVSSERLSAIGYGEYRAIASNDTKAGRAKNRRVEIIILPEYSEKRMEAIKDPSIK